MTAELCKKGLRSLLAASLFLLILSLGDLASAKGVAWRVGSPIAAGQVSRLELVFTDLSPKTRVTLPKVIGLEFVGDPGESRSTSIVNFKRTSSVIFTYRVRAPRKGILTIPSFTVETSEGKQQVPSIRLTIQDATLPGAGSGLAVPIEDVVAARLRTDTTTPFVGQVIHLDYLLAITGEYRANLASPLTWDSQGLIVEDWSNPENVKVPSGYGARFLSQAIAPRAGAQSLAPASLEVQIETGARTRGGLFGNREVAQISVASAPVPLEVRPLPTPSPKGFDKAVGRFHLTSKLVPERAVVGEPVTWTLTLEGEGNWPQGISLPARAIPSSMRTIEPKAERHFTEGKLFSGRIVEDLVLVPTHAGTYRLPPVRFHYFDPLSEAYRMAVVTPPPLVVVDPQPSNGQQPPGQRPTPTQGLPGDLEPGPLPEGPDVEAPSEPSLPQAPALLPGAEAPPALPRAPKPGSASSSGPLRSSQLGQALALPVVGLVLFWLGLALRRARRHDPEIDRRRAKAAVLEELEFIQHAGDPHEQRAALLRWQHETRTLLNLNHASPTARAVRDVANESAASLWKTSEDVLYAEGAELPAGWVDKARQWAQEIHVPRFNPFRAFKLRHLFPFLTGVASLALLVLGTGLVATPHLAKATEETSASSNTAATAAYEAGSFSEAEALFRGQLMAEPGDWVARYNLGLALAQQDQMVEAFAQSLSAFLLHPGDDDLRWNLRLLASRSEAMDPRLRPLIFPEGAQGLQARFALMASPCSWQGLLFGGALFSCLCMGLLLIHPEDRLKLPLRGYATPVLGASLLLVCLSTFALFSYGPAARQHAALVLETTQLRSVPTEAELPMEQQVVIPGSLVLVEKEFLSWSQIRLANEELGWLRSSALHALYPQVPEPSGKH